MMHVIRMFPARRLAVVLTSSVLLAGCAADGSPTLETGSLGGFGAIFNDAGTSTATPSGEANGTGGSSGTSPATDGAAPRAPKADLAELGRVHAAKPDDVAATLAYARALKAAGKPKDALAVVDAALARTPSSEPLLIEQGLLALELGQSRKARHALMRVSPETKDWRVLSGIGVANAGLGQHSEAQRYLEKALQLSPDNPAVLNNLALSYILDRKVDRGRDLLIRAAAAGGDRPQIARNLELARTLKPGGATSKPGGSNVEMPAPPASKPAPKDAPTGNDGEDTPTAAADAPRRTAAANADAP
jgi:Flp pilus assembly protein TadD